jgi:hypothetical protein
MATQNLFEKYGIKDVADVTFYRIERKEETYESQRNVSIKSILKGAVELRTVYPMENGVSIDEGFDAYVFTDASIITGVNYDCDDKISTKVTFSGSFEVTEVGTTRNDNEEPTATGTAAPADSVEINFSETSTTLQSNVIAGYSDVIVGKTNEYVGNVIIRDAVTKRQITLEELDDNEYTAPDGTKIEITYSKGAVTYSEHEDDDNYDVTYTVTFIGTADIDFTAENGDLATGVYSTTGREIGDLNKAVGTHEYTYAEQAFMLFAKR